VSPASRDAHRATGIECFLSYSASDVRGSDAALWTFNLTWGDVGGQAASAVVSYSHYGHPTAPRPGGRQSIISHLPTSVGIPRPRLVGVGGALDNYFFTTRRMPTSEVVLVQPDSRLAAPLARVAGDPGFDAVLEVTDDPAKVIQRYINRTPGDKIEDRTDRTTGTSVRTLFYELDGSVDTTLTLVSSGSRSWLLVSRSWEP
jgi:hypothetical protein